MHVPKEHNYVDDEMKEACLKVLDSHQYYMGPQNDSFEAEAAALLGTKHAIAVNSGTSAFFLILKALGVAQGDEVIIPAMSFVSLPEAVLAAGARARFVDVEDETYNLDTTKLEAAWNPAVRAVVPSHFYGHPADMDRILNFAKTHGLAVIEDCAHAFGAQYNGKYVGGLGVAGFTSFAGKGISVCGLGGMVVTNDDDVAHSVRLLRDHGRPRSGGVRFYDIERAGYNLRLSELHAAVGRIQLRHLLDWNRARNALADKYREAIRALDLPVIAPAVLEKVTHSFLHCTIRIGESRRDALKTFFSARGIETSILYPIEAHLLHPYRVVWGHRPGDFPVTERLTHEVLSLPNPPSMTDEMLSSVLASLTEFCEQRIHRTAT